MKKLPNLNSTDKLREVLALFTDGTENCTDPIVLTLIEYNFI